MSKRGFLKYSGSSFEVQEIGVNTLMWLSSEDYTSRFFFRGDSIDCVVGILMGFRWLTSLVVLNKLLYLHMIYRGAVLACALPWLKSLLLQHSSSIMSQESSLAALNSLFQVRGFLLFRVKDPLGNGIIGMLLKY